MNKFIAVIAVLLLMISGCEMMKSSHTPARIAGVFWQPDLASTPPKGNWQLLGADIFIPQWSKVDGQSWLKELDSPHWEKTLPLAELKKKPWAKQIILGLAGEYNETQARKNIEQHHQDALKIIAQKLPVNGYYFPIEADPSWTNVYQLGMVLQQLPQPMWVSVYSAEAEPQHFSFWVSSWLPPKDKVFFQDGVGVGTRSPQQALKIFQSLEQKLGADRTAIVLEAFRPNQKGGFRAAYPWEIIQQLKAYEGKTVYLFDGPHYVNRLTVHSIQLWSQLHYH